VATNQKQMHAWNVLKAVKGSEIRELVTRKNTWKHVQVLR